LPVTDALESSFSPCRRQKPRDDGSHGHGSSPPIHRLQPARSRHGRMESIGTTDCRARNPARTSPRLPTTVAGSGGGARCRPHRSRPSAEGRDRALGGAARAEGRLAGPGAKSCAALGPRHPKFPPTEHARVAAVLPAAWRRGTPTPLRPPDARCSISSTPAQVRRLKYAGADPGQAGVVRRPPMAPDGVSCRRQRTLGSAWRRGIVRNHGDGAALGDLANWQRLEEKRDG